MSFELRGYQEQAIEDIKSEILKGNKKVILCATMGAGKTSIVSEIISRMMKKHSRCLFLVHRRELVKQAAKRFKDQHGIHSGIIMGGYERIDMPVMCSSIQSLQRKKPESLPDADVIFIDEAHRSLSAGYQKIIEHYEGKIIIAMTATPFRGDGRSVMEAYDGLVHPITMLELIDSGFLVPTKNYIVKEVDFKDVKMRGSDYDKEEVGKILLKNDITKDAFANYKKILSGIPTIAFCSTVEQSKYYNEYFRANGVNSAHVDADTTQEDRDQALKGLASGRIKVLFNVGLYCLDSKTEILTSSGWVGMNEIDYAHEVANFNPNDKSIFFSKPKRVIKRKTYEGEEFIECNSPYMDFRLTDKHNSIYYSDNNNWNKVKSEELVGKQVYIPIHGNAEPFKFELNQEDKLRRDQYIVKRSHHLRKKNPELSDAESRMLANERYDEVYNLKYKNPDELTDAELEFIGFWIGDGTVGHLDKGGVEYQMFQSDAYPEICDYVDNLFRRVDVDFVKRKRESVLNGVEYHPLNSWSFGTGKGGSSQKRSGVYRLIPYLNKSGTDLFWGLSRNQFLSLIKGLDKADGDHKYYDNHNGYIITNCNKGLLDLLQSIAVCRGIKSTISQCYKNKGEDDPHNDRYTISFNPNKDFYNSAHNKSIIKTDHSKEMVWCVTTDSGYIVTRRNGRVHITGNCEGLDVPALGGVMLLRKTASPNLFLQMVGRCQRPFGDKKHGIVLDYGNNTLEHGIPEDYDQVDFRSYDREKGARRKSVNEGKLCPKCNKVNSFRVKVCECGHEFPERKVKQEITAGDVSVSLEIYESDITTVRWLLGLKSLSEVPTQHLRSWYTIHGKNPSAAIYEAYKRKDIDYKPTGRSPREYAISHNKLSAYERKFGGADLYGRVKKKLKELLSEGVVINGSLNDVYFFLLESGYVSLYEGWDDIVKPNINSKCLYQN